VIEKPASQLPELALSEAERVSSSRKPAVLIFSPMRYLIKLASSQEKSPLSSTQSTSKYSAAARSRGRIPAQRAASARGRCGCRDLGWDLFLWSAAGGRTPILGRILRFTKCKGRALATQLPARKWNRTVGLLRLCLHATAGRKTSWCGQIISAGASAARSTTVAACLWRVPGDGAQRRGYN